MARSTVSRLPAVGFAAGLALALASALLGSFPSVAAAGSRQTAVSVSASVTPVALLRVERGAPLVVRVGRPDGAPAGEATVVSFPKALALEVVANAPWKLTVASAGDFPVRVRLSSATAGAALQLEEDSSGAMKAYGRAGRVRLTWDVTVTVSPGMPEGVYAVPLVVELTTA